MTPSHTQAGSSNGALFGVPIWNPQDHGIHNAPLMVPAHEYNRVASNLADALSLALQHVPLTGEDADKIRELERAATLPPMNTVRPPLKPGDWIRKCYDYEHPKPGCGGDFSGRAHSPLLCRPQQVRAVNADGSVQCDLQGPGSTTYTVRKFIRAEGPRRERFPRLCSDGKLLIDYMRLIIAAEPYRMKLLAEEAIAKVEASQYPGLGE